MTWLEYHTESSRAAAEAEAAARERATERARSLYRRAAEAEEKALSKLDRTKRRTLGITAVSAVALWCKGGHADRAKQLADQLAKEDLPAFAARQIREILEAPPAGPGRSPTGEVEGKTGAFASDAEDLRELLDVRDPAADVEQALGKLRPEYRQAVVLRHVEDLPFADIAEIMAVPVGTVKAYVYRGRMELQEMLAHPSDGRADVASGKAPVVRSA